MIRVLYTKAGKKQKLFQRHTFKMKNPNRQKRSATMRNCSMEQSLSCEAKCFSACQEIPYILCKPKVPYRMNNSLTPVPFLSQNDLVYTTCHFLKSKRNTTLPSNPGSSKWLIYVRSHHQKSVWKSPPIRVTRPTHPILREILKENRGKSNVDAV